MNEQFHSNQNSTMAGPHSNPKPKDRYICLVDADRKTGSQTIQILVKCGFKIDYFVKAESALIAIKNNNYRLVILDLNVTLKNYSGDLLVNVIRKNDSFRDRIIPIIVISGQNQKENLNKAYKAGANGLLVKPLSYEKLLKRIYDLIASPENRAIPLNSMSQNSVNQDKTESTNINLEFQSEIAANDKVMTINNAAHFVPPEPLKNQSYSLSKAPDDISRELHKLDKDILVSLLHRQIIKNQKSKQTLQKPNNQVLHGEYQSRSNQINNQVSRVGNNSEFPPLYKEPITNTDSPTDIPPIQNISMRSYRFFGPTLIILLLIGIGFYFYWNPSSVHTVDTAKVEFGSLHRTISISGKVISENKVDITPYVYGQITDVPVTVGDIVSTNQVLAVLKNNDTVSRVKQATGKLSSAKQREILSKTTYERLRKAYELGAVSLQELEEQQAYLGTAQTQLTISEEEYNTATLDFEKLKITAPFSGTIISQNAQVGQQVNTTDILFTIADMNKRAIEVMVDTADSSSIQVGQSVEMSTDAFPDKKWHEKVIRVAPATNKKNRTNSVSVFLSFGENAPELRFGQQVDASITTYTSKETLVLPLSAIIRQDNMMKVGIIENNKVNFIPVLTGEEDMTHAEIKNGLSLGQIVMIPKGSIKDGDKVLPLKTQQK